MRKILTIFWILLFLFSFGRAEARNIYLNGVKINGVRGQTFTNVTVKIDANGDIYIIGKQYKVVVKKPLASGQKPADSAKKGAPAAAAKPSAPVPAPAPRVPAVGPPPTKKYILFAQRTGAQGSGYRLIVRINGKKVTTITVNTPQEVIPITKYLKKGANRVEIEAIKIKPGASGEVLLIIAEGSIEGGRVAVQQPYLLQYKRTASEKQNFKHIYTFTAQ